MRNATGSNGLWSLLYNHNPFYLLSSLLVLYSIHVVQPADRTDPTVLALSIFGFTVVLAVTAFLIVRLGGVWDDARSIMLSILLMFFALSVSFDHLCISQPMTAAIYLTAGFLVCIAVSEFLLIGLNIHFPNSYRLPYYAILLCMFFYPLVFASIPVYSQLGNSWLVYGFSLLCGLAVLTLAPAVWLGQKQADNNGTPWKWPMYPWSVFAVLIVAVMLRAYLLSLSFVPAHGWNTSFGLYFLAPIVFAVLLLMLIGAKRSHSKGYQRLVLASLPVIVLVSLPYSSTLTYNRFLGEFASVAGTPLWLACVGLVALYCIAFLMRVDGARTALLWSTFALTFVNPETFRLAQINLHMWWPSCLAAVVVLSQFKREQDTRYLLYGAALLCFSAAMFLNDLLPASTAVIAAMHIFLLACAVLSIVLHDRIAIAIRFFIALALPVLVLAAITVGMIHMVSWQVVIAYTLLLAMMAWLMFAVCRQRLLLHCSVAATVLVGVVLQIGVAQYSGLEIEPSVQRPFILAAACFGVGALVSAAKAGAINKIGTTLKSGVLESIKVYRAAG